MENVVIPAKLCLPSFRFLPLTPHFLPAADVFPFLAILFSCLKWEELGLGVGILEIV
jgi:hypothetical protein